MKKEVIEKLTHELAQVLLVKCKDIRKIHVYEDPSIYKQKRAGFYAWSDEPEQYAYSVDCLLTELYDNIDNLDRDTHLAELKASIKEVMPSILKQYNITII
jgi:hypothetical protein